MTPGLLPPLVKGGPTMPDQPLRPPQPLPQQSNSRKKKAFTLHAWSNIPGKMALFDQLAKLKRKKASNTPSAATGVSAANSESKLHQQQQHHNQGHHHQHHALKASKPGVKQSSSSTSEWLNVEKSVRFTLPPNEVKKRSSKANSRVTFIPKEDLIIQPDRDAADYECWNHQEDSFWDLRRNYSLEAFDQTHHYCSSHSLWTSSQPHPQQSCHSCCCQCYATAVMQPIKRPSIRRSSQKSQQHSHHHSPIEIQPDYTEDENEDHCNSSAKNVAFSYYPSGSMTLPHPKKSSQKATEKSAEKGGAETAAAQNTESVASNSSSPTKKSLNESGESDPGYESDSSKSKSNSGQALLMTEPKATTLPRRSATVQKNSALQHTLDRRKLRGQAELELEEPSSQSSASKTGTESEAGLTVEIISPVRLEHRDVAASQTLRAALSKVEAAHPGFSYDLVLGLVKKADANSVNMNESLLRLQGAVQDQDCIEYRSSRTEEPFQELNKKSVALKRILARIPEEISDRKTFLETIKEIASAIKKLLDAVNEVSAYIPGTSGKQALDQKKREFVKYSKRFSNTLKEFFRDGQPSPVFNSATYLIYQTNQVMITVKDKCE